MNIYDERYVIRLATIEDIPDIMHFLHVYWRENHILSVDRNLFEYEFLDDDRVNFIIAIDKKTFNIEALAGFLPCSSTSDTEKLDVWGSFWKVNRLQKNIPLLGVELLKRLQNLLQYRSHIGVGVNPKTALPLGKKVFQEYTEKMKHYYILNSEITDYKIAIINQPVYIVPDYNTAVTNAREFHSVEEIEPFFNIELLDTIPYKDFWYINKRFFSHPYYNYHVYGLYDTSSDNRALLIGREILQFDRRIFRIVDYIGEQSLLSGCGHFLQNMLRENHYEYIDFYNFGFEHEYLHAAGFSVKGEEDTNIIPNYFEPFLQENVDIWIRYPHEGTRVCKADGDQDRPNIAKVNKK